MGWKISDFSLAAELKADEHGPALCDNKIDGFYYGVGHPSRQHPGPDHDLRRQAGVAHRPGGRQAAQGQPLLRQGDHPGRHVFQQPAIRPRPTACWQRWSTSAKVPDDVVYNLVKATFDNFEEFKKLHPAFANLEPAKEW